jgi:predicted HNH restriction endonuclease
MGRTGDFDYAVKLDAYSRQQHLCAWCGVELKPPRTPGSDCKNTYYAEAHHLHPLDHAEPGQADKLRSLENCVYLCYACHKLAHGMSPYCIDKQGGSSKTWVKLRRSDFPYWNGRRKAEP